MPTSPNETSYAPQTGGNGPPFRLIQQQVGNPVNQTEDVEAVIATDEQGFLQFDVNDRTARREQEFQAIAGRDSAVINMLLADGRSRGRISTTDRRGSVERGMTR